MASNCARQRGRTGVLQGVELIEGIETLEQIVAAMERDCLRACALAPFSSAAAAAAGP